MRGLNSKEFFFHWKAIQDASNPGLKNDRWRVGGVDWVKERHVYWGERCSFHIETHTLECREGDRLDWLLLVVIERWWGANKDRGLRQTQWARMLVGPAQRALAWVKRQAPEA